MLIDCHSDRHDLVRQRVAQFWPCPPVDDPRRQVEQQINDAWRLTVEQVGVKLLKLWPNARQAGERSKQRIED